MSGKISDVVSVNITRAYTRVSQQGFGVPLILGSHSRIADRVKAYTSLEEMRADNFKVGDTVYDAAVAVMSQTPKVEQFKVGRVGGAYQDVWEVTFSERPVGGTFTVSFGGGSYSHPFNDTDANIEADVITDSNYTAVTVDVTPSSGTAIRSFTITATAGTSDVLEINPAALISTGGNAITATVVQSQVYSVADSTLSDTWDAILTADEDWYGLITSDLHAASDRATQLFYSNMIETQERKVYSIRTTDAATVAADYSATSPADISSDIKAAGYEKSWVTYTTHTDEYPDAAIVGLQFPKPPGSSTYKFKSPVTITSEDLGTASKNHIKSRSTNWIETIAGVKMYAEGTTCEGEFIDITIGCDFTAARVGETVFAALAGAEKISYSASGLVLIQSQILSALNGYAVANGIIDGSTIIITMPDINTIPTADKASRVVNNVTFTAALLGAIHKINIEGKLYL